MYVHIKKSKLKYLRYLMYQIHIIDSFKEHSTGYIKLFHAVRNRAPKLKEPSEGT